MTPLPPLEQNFKNLIISQCKFCKFDQYLKQNPDFEFPKITSDLLGWENGQHITIPGLFGGFDYFLEELANRPILFAEQSSRMDHDEDDYSYFKITEDGNVLLEGKERKSTQEKFRKLHKKSFKDHLQELKELRKKVQ